jgi:RND family efflux transporter MFP subunit
MRSPLLPRCLPFLLLLLPTVGCGGDPPPAKPAARPVLAVEVESATRAESAYTGVIAARTESDLGFRVGGKIVERRVDPGDRVAAGDTLLVLDVEDFELALRAVRNRVRAAEANLKQARDDESRYRQLSETGFESKRTFELATTGLQVAEAELAAARSDARQIENQRGYATLVADGDGIVTEVNVERGQVVSVGQVVARLAHDGAREAVVSIPETQRDLAANPARAFAFGDSATAIPATLRELSASADPVTRTFRARYVLADEAAQLPIGSTITVRLANADPDGLTRAPIGALHDPGTGPGVWLIDEQGRVRFSPVRVVKLGQEDVTIESVVAPGQRIVALGAHLLNEGDAVRTMRAPGELEPLASEHAQGE